MRDWLLGIVLLLAFCLGALPASAQTAYPVAPAQDVQALPAGADALLQTALDSYRAGKLHEAADQLRSFIVNQPDSTLINQAYYQLARIHRDLREPAAALDYLDRMAVRAHSPASLLLQGEVLLQLGDAVRAVDRLLQLDTQGWALPQRQERCLTLAEGMLALDAPHKALFFYQQALLLEGEQTPRDILARIYTLMSDRFSEADLAEAVFMYRDRPPAYLATLQLGWRALAAGQQEQARRWASEAMASPPGFAYREEALALLAQVSDPGHLQRAIGVLLPLSGRYAAFGKRVQRGMQLAQQSFRPHIPVRFIFRDTAGDEAVADQQAGELAIGERVMGLAGALVGNAAVGAARRAEREMTPLLTLSQREGLAASSRYVFRNSLTARLQVRSLLDYAMGARGFTTFGILRPADRQGEQFAALFREEVERRGGRIVAAQSYSADQTDFRRQVRLLRGLNPEGRDDEPQGGDSEVPDRQREVKAPPPFQAIFLPDYADRISLVAPQLAFYGLEGVQLLGTSGWNDTNLPRLARQSVEGAVFADGFFKHSSYPFVQEFVDRFFNEFGEEPTILEAQGYDVAGILLTLLNDPAVRDREELRRALAQLQDYPGVTGATRFDAAGEAEKILFLLQVQDGAIVQIN